MSGGGLDDGASVASGPPPDDRSTKPFAGGPDAVAHATRPATQRTQPEGALSIREALRAATGAAHRRLDAAMANFDLGDPTGYRSFLGVHRSSLRILTERWGSDVHGDFAAMLARLEHDLDDGDAVPVPAHRATDGPREAGVAYVLRGSRFGAAILRARIAPGSPSAYLDYRTVLSWPAFLAQLETTGSSIGRQGMRGMIDSAIDAFGVFADAVIASPAPR